VKYTEVGEYGREVGEYGGELGSTGGGELGSQPGVVEFVRWRTQIVVGCTSTKLGM
jgi:hypothetical protein